MPLESKTVQNFQGLFTSFQKLAQPKGAISLDSNLWFATRGALRTIPGSLILSSPSDTAPSVIWRAIQSFFPSTASTYKLTALSVVGASAALYDVTASPWYGPPLLSVNAVGGSMEKRPAILGGTPQPTPTITPFADKLILAFSDSVPPYMYDDTTPPAPPTLGGVSGGGLPATTYYVRITYTGYASPSTEVSLAVAANYKLTVSSPSPAPAGVIATSFDVYAGTAPGAETKQPGIPGPLGGTWTEPATGLDTSGGILSPLSDSPGGHQLLNNFNPDAKYGAWKANHNFKQGHIIAVLIGAINFEYEATASGKTGSGDNSPGNPAPTTFPTQVNATIVDGGTGWQCLGPIPAPPPGAAYAFNHLGFLWLWGTASTYLQDGISGPDALWQSSLNDPQQYDPAFTGYVGKGNGETAQGGAVLTLEESGIAATQQLVLFKDASTYSVFGDFSTQISILQAPGGVGCVAAGTVQYMAGLGVMRLSYKGMTLFDGQNDNPELYTDPIRGYLFGLTDPTTNEQIIAPIDWKNIQLAKSTQCKDPSAYVMIAPVSPQTPPTPPPPIGFVSSGAIAVTPPPAPVIVSATTYGFAFTGENAYTDTAVLPLLLTLDIPAGVQKGDLLVAFITFKAGYGNFGVLDPLATVPGWTLLQRALPFFQWSLSVLYHVVDGTEGSSVTFSGSGNGFGVYQMNGAIIPVRGANTASPLDVIYLGQWTQGGSANIPGVTTVNANDLLLLSLQPAGEGWVTPGNVPGTTVLVNAQSPNTGSPVTDTLAVWATPFAGPGPTGVFTSPTGWPLGAVLTYTLAISAGTAPVGKMMGFSSVADGAITPAPVITGPATGLVGPLGCCRGADGWLYVADSQSQFDGGIMVYINPAIAVGDQPPDELIQGPTNTLLVNPYDVGIDAAENIYVANYDAAGTGQILVYGAGSRGDVAPTTEIGGSNTGLVHPRSICVDSAGNVYVLDDTVNSIKVWLAGHIGNIAPDQTIVGAATLLSNPLQIRISPAGLLWVTCGKSGSTPAYLLAFKLTDNGNVAPQVQITSAALQPSSGDGGPVGLAFDTSGKFYIAMAPNNSVVVFAADASGASVPLQTITGFTQVGGIAGMFPLSATAGYGATRLFIYDLEAQIWAVGDLPWGIGAAAFLPSLSGSESVIGHISDGTTRRIMNPADLDWDGTKIVESVRLPEFGRSSQPIYLRRFNMRAEGSGKVTSVTARFKDVQGKYVVRSLLAPKQMTGPVDVQTKILSLHLDIGFEGQVVIEGIEYQITEKQPTRVGR